MRALDRLKKAASFTPIKKTVELNDGSEFEFWHTNLTMAEREKATKAAGSNDPNALAVQLLVAKALDENGEKMFKSAEIVELKNEVRDSDMQKIVMALISDEISTPVEMGN